MTVSIIVHFTDTLNFIDTLNKLGITYSTNETETTFFLNEEDVNLLRLSSDNFTIETESFMGWAFAL